MAETKMQEVQRLQQEIGQRQARIDALLGDPIVSVTLTPQQPSPPGAKYGVGHPMQSGAHEGTSSDRMRRYMEDVSDKAENASGPSPDEPLIHFPRSKVDEAEPGDD